MQTILLNNPGDKISSKDKGRALLTATIDQYPDIVQTLLEKVGEDIPIEYKECALQIIIYNNGDFNIIKQLEDSIDLQLMENAINSTPIFTPSYNTIQNTNNKNQAEEKKEEKEKEKETLISDFQKKCNI